MIAFLTSHIGGSYIKDNKRIPAPLIDENGFLTHLQKHWNAQAKVLLISSDADASEINDSIRSMFAAAFPMSGCPISQIDLCDRRNESVVQKLSAYDAVILCGGHVPTQNTFFQRIRLKDHLKSFDGILIGISAGTMNSASLVYAQPELPGESTDPSYQRFLPGLGITERMILPHYQETKDELLDGRRLFEDITYPDSCGRKFYALTDGSYLMVEQNADTASAGVQDYGFRTKKETLFGEAYLIEDGTITRICQKDQRIELP